MIPKRFQLPTVARQSIIPEMTLQYHPKPLAHLSYRPVQPTTKLLFKKPELGQDALAHRMPENRELSIPGSPTDMGKAQKVEGLRFTLAPASTILGRKTPKLQNAGFAAVKLQAKRSEALDQLAVEPLGFLSMLKADDKVIAESDDHHIPKGLFLSPLVRPQIKHIVKINVGQQWADAAAFPCRKLPCVRRVSDHAGPVQLWRWQDAPCCLPSTENTSAPRS